MGKSKSLLIIICSLIFILGLNVLMVDYTSAEDTVTVGLTADFKTFNPYSLAGIDLPNRNIYDTLIRYGEGLEPKPHLVTDWEIDNDWEGITIQLRKGVLFHNGREMKAEDVVKNFKKVQDPEFGSHLHSRVESLESVEAIDDYKVKINFKSATPNMMGILEEMPVIAPESFDEINENPIGTGPFKFVKWVPGNEIVLEKNEDYWVSGVPKIDKIVFKPYNDLEALIVAIETKTIDVATNIPLRAVEHLQEIGANVQPGNTESSLYVVAFNPQKSPFDKKEVRQAMQYALAREDIAELILYGTSKPTTSHFASESLAYKTEYAEYYDYDLDKAKELLESAGYPDGFKATVLAPSAWVQLPEMAQILSEDLGKIGVDLEVKVLDSAQWYPKLHGGDYQATFSFVGVRNVDPNNFFHNSMYRLNNNPLFPEGNFPPGYRETVNKGMTSTDLQERKEAFYEVQEILLEQSWVCPIATKETIIVTQDYIDGLTLSVGNVPRFDEVELKQ